MKLCYPTFYKSFVCSASECKDTCCKFWQVELDSNSKARYKSLIKDGNDVGYALKKGISGNSFKNIGNSCYFLNNCGLCNLYSMINHDGLPRTCRLYPRFINNFGGYEERGLSFSCEVSAKIISNNKLVLVTEENNEPITEYTNVDAETFNTVKAIRDKILNYIDGYNGSLEELVNILLNYSKTVEEYINADKFNLAINAEFNNILDDSCFLYDTNLKRIVIKKHLKNKILRDNWKEILNNALTNEPSYSLETFKIWASYFIYRYLIKASFTKEIYKTITSSIISYMVISSIDFEFINAAQLYSKEVEHNTSNINKLFKFEFNKYVEK
ncbi:MAG: hypothetical protein E7540_01835 [Ruminococcaceae bacterium]|nr:hypothetical protein [Oscillospiraceae bacterium]